MNIRQINFTACVKRGQQACLLMKLALKFWRLLWTRNSILAQENYDHISIKLAYYYISFTATATWIPCLNLSSIKRCGEETPGHCITAPHLLYFIIYICIILITILLFQLDNCTAIVFFFSPSLSWGGLIQRRNVQLHLQDLSRADGQTMSRGSSPQAIPPEKCSSNSSTAILLCLTVNCVEKQQSRKRFCFILHHTGINWHSTAAACSSLRKYSNY